MEIKKIYEQVNEFLGKEVSVKGWIRQHRKQKEIGFIELSDGTCFKKIQVVYDNTNDFDKIQKIKFGSAIEATGILQKSPINEEQLEIKTKDIILIGDCEEDYPIQPKRHTREFLREQAYLRPRTNLFQAIFRIRSVASMAIHDFFQKEGFIYLHAPIFTASDCEGAGEMFQVTTQDLDEIAKKGKVDYSKDFFGKKVGLSVSTQFEAETFAQAFSKVYTFGPTFRADKSHTPYHLAEFWQIEPEVAFCDLEGIMNISEKMMKHVIKYVLDNAKDEMNFLDKNVSNGLIEKLTNVIESDFKRVTYNECIKILIESGKDFEFKPEYGADISKEHEKYITEYFNCPIFITYWPKELKSFYMKQMDDGTVAAADLELPGIGETFGMSEREVDYDKLLSRMNELNMNIEDYDWYLKLRKYGTCTRSGYGIGFERLLMYLTGMESVRDVMPYPRAHKTCEF